MTILAAVALIGVLVFIHEFGHFVVAKLCGVQVTVFSFGFGRRLVGFEWGGTDYRLSLLPFGGYVQMAGADPFGTGEEDDDILEDPSKAFLRKPVWQRLLVVGAGPAFNLALPVVVFTALLMAGEPQPAAAIGSVEADTPAWSAGLQAGDVVVEVAGTPVQTWEDMSSSIQRLGVGSHRLVVERGAARTSLEVAIDAPGSTAVGLGLGHRREAAIAGVDDHTSPAGAAGIRTGDRIVALDGKPVEDWVDVERAFASVLGRGASTVAASVERDGDVLDLVLHRPWEWRPVSPVATAGLSQNWGLLPATLFIGDVAESVDPSDGGGMLAGCRPSEQQESPALRAGFQPGDRFVAVDGRSITDWADVLTAVKGTMSGDGTAATARPIEVSLLRDGATVTTELTPIVIEDTDLQGRYYFRPILGVVRAGDYVDGPMYRRYYSFPEAITRGSERTVLLAGFIVEQLGKLVTGEAAVEKSLGGPLEIGRQATLAFERGLFEYVNLIGMLSISLGIINLLPVPVLDGGQILFFAVEAVRGRPLSQALRERAQQLGVLFLVLLMLSVLVIDINRLFEGGP